MAELSGMQPPRDCLTWPKFRPVADVDVMVVATERWVNWLRDEKRKENPL